MEPIEWDDVQGLLLSGYPELKFSAYVVWRFRPDRIGAACRWLADLAGRLMRAAPGHHQGAHQADAVCRNIQSLKAVDPCHRHAVNLALTADGLRRLRLDEHRLSEFALEFLEGMAPRPSAAAAGARRSNLLGDTGDSAPGLWDWGGTAGVDGMLLLYAADAPSLQALIDVEVDAMSGACEVVTSAGRDKGRPVIIKGRLYDDMKEHFGFRDGVSQPMIAHSPKADRDEQRFAAATDDTAPMPGRRDRRISLVKTGEFVLGYENERRERIRSAFAGDNPGACDLMRNGTYLVFRQLEQDVAAFDAFAALMAKQLYGVVDRTTTERAAARLIGRNQDGDPLISPSADSPKSPVRNDFLYSFEDGAGMACPIGSHIRRANPRDVLGPDPDTALRLSKMHRIIRRGRPYGPRRSDDGGRSSDGSESRGIAFIALNADIAGQFEMIQNSWLNNPSFGGLQGCTDPIGHVAPAGDTFVVQRRPSNLHVGKPRPFVTVRGGAYFFLPGIKATRAIADAAVAADPA